MRKSSGATAIFMTSKFRFQLGFSRIIFLILYQFMTFFSKFLIFWLLFSYQKLFSEWFIFIVIQRNFFVKIRLFFWIKGLREVSLTSTYQWAVLKKVSHRIPSLLLFHEVPKCHFVFEILYSEKQEYFFIGAICGTEFENSVWI